MTERSEHARPRLSALVVVAVLLVTGGAAFGGYYTAQALHRSHRAPGSLAALPSALASATAAAPTPSAGSAGAPLPSAPGVAAALRGPASSAALGELRGAVVDASSGTVLYQQGTGAAAPASTAKLLTAAAVLEARGAQYRITTTLRTDGAGTLVLVGGGDPTITAAAAGQPGAYPDAARLADLAAAARSAHLRVRRILVDDSAFTGPAVSAKWASDDVPSSYGAAITAVMADGGRPDPGAVIRSASPDLAAGQELAALLGDAALPVTRGSAATAATTVRTVQSATIAQLVGQMLQNSDNVIAECLARQVAIAHHADPSFVGAARAIRTVLAGLHADPGGGMLDGSGLAAADRLTAPALVAVLSAIASPGHPELHDIVTALPVGGWSGTLASRYLSGAVTAGAGVVRAKTGTLTEVSSLAGLLTDADGRLLAFALLADHVPDTNAAEASLDAIAATLVRCGCR